MWKSLCLASIFASAAVSLAAEPAPKSVAVDLTIEDVMMRLFEEPDAHFHKARERFFKRDYKGSADAVRTASAFVKLEAIHSAKGGDELLARTSAELERLADGVQQGTIRNGKLLDRAFARAHVTMGRGHNLKAVNLIGQGNTAAAGKQFQASFHHAIHAYQWGGVEEKEDAKAILKSAGKLAGRITAEAKDLQAEIKKDVAAVGKVLEDLSHELRVNEEMKEIWAPMH